MLLSAEDGWWHHDTATMRPSCLEPFPQRGQVRGEAGQLTEVQRSQCLEATGALGGEREAHDPTIIGVDMAGHQTRTDGPIHELDGAVVAEEEVGSHVAHRGAATGNMPTDGQQELVLGAGQSDGGCLALTPLLKVAQPVTEGEEALIVGFAQPAASHIVSRYSSE